MKTPNESLETAWSAVCLTGKAVRIERNLLIVAVADEREARIIDGLNAYKALTYRMNGAGHFAKAIRCMYPVAA